MQYLRWVIRNKKQEKRNKKRRVLVVLVADVTVAYYWCMTGLWQIATVVAVTVAMEMEMAVVPTGSLCQDLSSPMLLSNTGMAPL